MSAVMKRSYRRIDPEHLKYARKRFGEFAATGAVRAELRAMGGEYSHSQLHYHWHQANKRDAARAAVSSSDADPGDQQDGC